MTLLKKVIILILLMEFCLTAQENKGYLSNYVSNIHYGINTDITAVIDYVNNPYGSRIKSDYCALIDVAAEFDLKSLAGLNNSELFIEMIGVHSDLPTESLRALQCLSNIEAPSMIRIYEAWFKQNFFNNDLYLLFGLRDFNSSFDVIQNASLFVNSSHGLGCEISQTGRCGPSTYPYTGLGLELGFRAADYLQWRSILLEDSPGNYEIGNWQPALFSNSSGVFIASEFEVSFDKKQNFQNGKNNSRGIKKGRRFGGSGQFKRGRKYFNRNLKSGTCFSSIKLGGWYYTSEFEDSYQKIVGVGKLQHRNNLGVYFSFENLERISRNSKKFWGSFIRVGIANPDINFGHYYLGAGLTLSQPFNLGEENEIGISSALIFTGDKFRRGMSKLGVEADKYEAVIELTYRANLFDVITIQPDLQYVINPGALKKNGNETVIILRTEILI